LLKIKNLLLVVPWSIAPIKVCSVLPMAAGLSEEETIFLAEDNKEVIKKSRISS